MLRLTQTTDLGEAYAQLIIKCEMNAIDQKWEIWLDARTKEIHSQETECPESECKIAGPGEVTGQEAVNGDRSLRTVILIR